MHGIKKMMTIGYYTQNTCPKVNIYNKLGTLTQLTEKFGPLNICIIRSYSE